MSTDSARPPLALSKSSSQSLHRLDAIQCAHLQRTSSRVSSDSGRLDPEEEFSPIEADIVDSFVMVAEDHLPRGDPLPSSNNSNDNNNSHNNNNNHDNYDHDDTQNTTATTAIMNTNDATESGAEPPAQDEQGGIAEQEQDLDRQEQGQTQELGQEKEQGQEGTAADGNKEDKDVNLPSTTALEEHDHDDSNASFLPPPLPDCDDSSLLLMSSEDDDHERGANQTLIEEKEMRRKLMDMESSFLPEPSTIEMTPTANENAGVDDTYLVGVPEEQAPPNDSTHPQDQSELSLPPADETDHDMTSTGDDGEPAPETPHYGAEEQDTTIGTDTATPAARPEQQQQQHEGESTTLENVASSPSVEAAARTVNRISGETEPASQTSPEGQQSADNSTAPQPEQPQTMRTSSQSGKSRLFDNSGSDVDATRAGSRRGIRPKYLTSRQSAQRLSYSSVATSNTETTHSDATLGADFALQSGGAAPGNASNPQAGQHNNMTRSVSLGSVASGISGYSDENLLEKRNPSGATDGGLQTLNEEEGPSQSRPGSPGPEQAMEDSGGPMTPRAKPPDSNLPTDTAIAERIKDIQVPSTFARQFREDLGHRGLSPERRGGTTPAFGRSGRSMTLKEQSSTIDRLSKENFDLKMRIHFLNEALNKRSEEGIKEMISENVELKSDKVKLQKDNQGLKRKMRDLEKQLKDQQSDKASMFNHDPEGSDDEHRDPMQEEEMLFLRERAENYEVEIERLRSESIAREGEKRRLAEMVKSLSGGRPIGSDVESREERDMWKDMLDAETAAREQAEEENKRLRDETLRLRSEMEYAMGGVRAGQRDPMGPGMPYSTTPDQEYNRTTVISSSNDGALFVELDLLKQENAELRKEVGAQTSMLTSRNREKERLYQEIEELKLGQRRDGSRSVTGDSIFDRSASRAHGRSSSRTSDVTGVSPNDGADREELEVRNGQLRDQVSSLKLENQGVRDQLDEYVQELEALDKAYQADVDQAEEEIQNLQQERDQALQMAEERDAAFQDLRGEAQEELDALGDELDQKIEECQRLNEEVRNQDENLRVLQAEMRSAGEGIIRLEEDAQNNLERYQAVQQELEDSNREMESLEKDLYESNTKAQRITVQIESSHNEIAFLREEQDGDKIKIGDLESELKTYEINLGSEKDKTRELEARLADERHQREVVGGKEKQELQRIMNELNREASAAKDEARRLKKGLSAQEIETSTWRERLLDLENNLREALGDLTGSRSSLITNIVKLQKELESTALELESTRSKLDEKESILHNRDALLESHGLESRKLSELLHRERHARRADKQSFEQALKSHHQASRTITQNNSRISDLELARNQERKRFTGLEQQFKDQLSERNAMLLTIWRRLSAMCGPDWAHSNSLINGNLPSQEVIGNILFWPGFSRNLMLAVKTVEAVISGFKNRIKGVERDLTKQHQTLEHNYSLRVKKLDRLEESVMNMRAQQHSKNQSGLSPEMAKIRGENRLLKAELNLIQSHSRSRGPVGGASASPSRDGNANMESGAERGLVRSSTTGNPQPSHLSSATTLADHGGAMVHGNRARHGPGDPGNSEKWNQRLRELEKRLKAEREARLLDRGGARKRLEERDAENQRLRAQIERQQVRRGIFSSGPSADDNHHQTGNNRARLQYPGRIQTSDGQHDDHGDEEHSSSEGADFSLEIEYEV